MILEAMYNGEFYPCETVVPTSPEYRKAVIALSLIHICVEIRPLQRYKALGNAIALPCADYIMAGIYEVLADRAGKEE